MYTNDVHAILRMEELRRERWNHPAERHRRAIKANRGKVGGVLRRSVS